MTVPVPNVSLREITSANRAAVEALTVSAASPLGFYLRRGFRATGEVHEDELVLELALLAPRSS